MKLPRRAANRACQFPVTAVASLTPAQVWRLDALPATWDRAVPLFAAPRTHTRAGVLLVLLGIVLLVSTLCRDGLWAGSAGRGAQVCNSFDYSRATRRCTAADSFVVVRQGDTAAYLQIADSGAAPFSKARVAIGVTETNGSGLVIARGAITRFLHTLSTGVTAVPLKEVLDDTGVPLTVAPMGSPSWINDTYLVQVREGTTVLGSAMFHAAH